MFERERNSPIFYYWLSFGPFLTNIDISRWIKEMSGSASRFEQRPTPAFGFKSIVTVNISLQMRTLYYNLLTRSSLSRPIPLSALVTGVVEVVFMFSDRCVVVCCAWAKSHKSKKFSNIDNPTLSER